MTTNKENQPQWDIALESLLRETQKSKGSALGMDDLHALAAKHTIRLDDILDTLCLLSEHQAWSYFEADGSLAAPDDDMAKHLHANKRLNDAQLERFDGSWAPN